MIATGVDGGGVSDRRRIIAELPGEVGAGMRVLGGLDFFPRPFGETRLLPGGFETHGHLLDLPEVF